MKVLRWDGSDLKYLKDKKPIPDDGMISNHFVK